MPPWQVYNQLISIYEASRICAGFQIKKDSHLAAKELHPTTPTHHQSTEFTAALSGQSHHT